jgi:hypothetical protein
MAAVAQAQQLMRAAQASASMRTAQPHLLAAPLRTPAASQTAAHAALAARIAAAAAQRRAGSSLRRRAAAPAAAAPAAVEELTIQPVRVIEGHVKLPGSKSLSNRILLLAALAEGTTTVENILVSPALPTSGGRPSRPAQASLDRKSLPTHARLHQEHGRGQAAPVRRPCPLVAATRLQSVPRCCASRTQSPRRRCCFLRRRTLRTSATWWRRSRCWGCSSPRTGPTTGWWCRAAADASPVSGGAAELGGVGTGARPCHC